jgi:alpha-N-acetylgalactosaminidase
MGAALEASGRDIVYSCSWPAYIGSNESEKPFDTFILDGCNLWRNWDDIQCDWGSLSSIIDHWGDWGSVLAPYAGPGHWHDPGAAPLALALAPQLSLL